MKAKDLLKYSVKKTDVEDATLKEIAKIAKTVRRHVWEGLPADQTRNTLFFQLLGSGEVIRE